MPVVRNNGGGHRTTRSHGRIAISGWQPETELRERANEDGNEYEEVDMSMSRHLYLDAFQDTAPDAQDAAEHREHATIQLHDHDEEYQNQTMTPSSTSSYTLHPTSPPVYFRRTTGQSLTSMPSSVSISSSSQHHRHQLPTPPTSRTSSPSSGSPPEGRGRPRGSGSGSKSSTERRARRNRERDPSWVPRPKNAFFQFRRAFVREHKERKEAARNGHAGTFVGVTTGDGDFHPSDKSAVSLSKIAGDAWKLLAPEEKERWKKMAEDEREEHARNHPDYRFRPVRRGPSAKQKARMIGSFGFDDATMMIKDEEADLEQEIARKHTIPTMVLHGRGRSLDLSPPTAFLRLRQSTSSPCGSVSSSASAPSRSSSSSPSFDYASSPRSRSWCSSPEEAGMGDLHQLRLSSSSPSASASVPIYYPNGSVSHYSHSPSSTRPSTPYNDRSELILPSLTHQSHHTHHHSLSLSHSYPRVPSPLSLAPIQAEANPATPPPSEACDTLGQVQSNLNHTHSQPQTGSAGHATYYTNTNSTTTSNNEVQPGQGSSSRDYFNLFTDLDDSHVLTLNNLHYSSNGVLQEQDITPRHNIQQQQQQQSQRAASQPGVSTSTTTSSPASIGRTMSPLTAVYTSVAHLNLAQHQHQHQHQYAHPGDASASPSASSASASPASATTSSYSVPSITLTPPQASLHPVLPEQHHHQHHRRMIADVTLPVMQSPVDSDDVHGADGASLHQLCNGNAHDDLTNATAANHNLNGVNGNANNATDGDCMYQRDLDAYHMGVEHYNIGLGLDLGGVGVCEELDHLFPTTGDITDWALDFERASPSDAA